MEASRWICVAALSSMVATASAHADDAPAPATAETKPGVERDFVPRDGDDALRWLLEGNARFAAGRPRHGHEGMRRREVLTRGQHPAAVVLGCADSRVPPELVFDAGLGDLFVVRVAGNVAAEDEAGSIEYAVEHLQTPLVLVLGHEGCGAVTAAIQAPKGEIAELSRLLTRLEPAVRDIDPELPVEQRVQLGVEANVRRSVTQLRAILVREGGAATHPGLRIVGGVYDLDSGRVRLLD